MRILIRRDGEVIVREDGEAGTPADRSNPFDALRWFRAAVELEDGITAFQMMRALSPWSRALSAAGWIDFEAWLSAMSCPMVREAGEDEDERLSGIELHPVAYVNRGLEAGSRTASVSVAWRTLGRYAEPRQGPGGHVDEHCSVSFTDPRLIGHLPLSICTTLKVQDIRAMRPWGEAPVLPEAVPGVYDRLVAHPAFFDAIVLGFLDEVSFHGSPEDTEETAEGLRQAVEEIRSGSAETAPAEGGGLRGILADLGVDVEDEFGRGELGLRLAEAVSRVPAADAARVLGLTESGLEKLAGGHISGFSTGTLEDYVRRLEGLAGQA